jgi:hypothetical protein
MVRICAKEETFCLELFQVQVGQSLLPVDISIRGQSKNIYIRRTTQLWRCVNVVNLCV